MSNEVTINRPNPRTLIISRKPLAGVVVSAVIFLIAVYYLTSKLQLAWDQGDIFQQVLDRCAEDPMLWALLAFILLALGRCVWLLKILIQGEEFRFDGLRQTLMKNDEQIAPFREVDRIKVKKVLRPTHGDESPSEEYDHEITVALKNGDEIAVYRSGDLSATLKLAAEIAGLTNVQMAKVGYEPTLREHRGAV